MIIIKNDDFQCSNYSIGGFILNKEFILTVTIAAVLAFFFVFEGFVSGDSIRYALGVISIEENNFKILPTVFHTEMSFGYYLIIIWLKHILNFQGELSRLMNDLSAVASVLMIIFLFIFVQSLFNRKLAFFVCLSVFFSPSIWMLSHGGNPNIVAMAFFMGSLFCFDRILSTTPRKYLQGIYWIFFILLVFVMVTVRLDMVLGFGGYAGLLYFRQSMSISKLFKLIGALFLSLFLTFALRYSILGYVFSPFVSLLNYHLVRKLPAGRLPMNILKNLALWIMAANVFVSILAILGLRRFGLKSSLVALILAMVAPFLIFIPFQEIDISRVIAPTIPAISLLGMSYLYHKFESVKNKTLFMLLVLVLAQLAAGAIFYPAEYLYHRYAGIKMAIPPDYPMGFIPLDHFRLQRFVRAQDDIAKKVTAERNGNVLIVDFSRGVMYYIYNLMVSRSISSQELVWCNNIRLKKFVTKENIFFIMPRDINLEQRAPISTVLQCPKLSVNKIHLSSFSGELPSDTENLFLGDEKIKSLLENEISLFQHMREIIR